MSVWGAYYMFLLFFEGWLPLSSAFVFICNIMNHFGIFCWSFRVFVVNGVVRLEKNGFWSCVKGLLAVCVFFSKINVYLLSCCIYSQCFWLAWVVPLMGKGLIVKVRYYKKKRFIFLLVLAAMSTPSSKLRAKNYHQNDLEPYCDL